MPPEKQTPESYNARVAELVDAADSKSAIRKDVLVRFQSRAHQEAVSNKLETVFLFQFVR